MCYLVLTEGLTTTPSPITREPVKPSMSPAEIAIQAKLRDADQKNHNDDAIGKGIANIFQAMISLWTFGAVPPIDCPTGFMWTHRRCVKKCEVFNKC